MTLDVIKVCGLRSLESIQYIITDAATASVTHLGIICVPNRARTIPNEVATAIKPLLLQHCENTSTKRKQLVGVFRNQSFQEMKQLAHSYDLDVIQFHDDNEEWFDWSLKFLQLGEQKGEEDAAATHVIKRWCFPRDQEAITSYAKKIQDLNFGQYFSFLFDSEFGGEGIALDNWDEINLFVEALKKKESHVKFIVAGGLNPDNIASCLKTCSYIDGVDVSSGVETDGIKDLNKIEKFVKNCV